MAAGNAVLDVMLAPGFLDHVRSIGLLFKQRLAEIKDRYPGVIAEVRGEGLLLGLRCVVPNGELVDALRDEKLLDGRGRRQCRAAAAAADRDREPRSARRWACSSAPARGLRAPRSRRSRGLWGERAGAAALPRSDRHPRRRAARDDRGEPRHEGSPQARPRERRQAARRQDAGDDLRQALDAHARLVRCRDAPARRRRHDAHRPGDAARPRRDHRRHRARAVALCRCDHDPHPRPRSAGRACAARDRPGDQRPDAALASLPGDGRCDDLRGASGADQAATPWPGPATATTCCLLDACGAALRFPPKVATPPELKPTEAIADWAKQSGAAIEIGHDPEEAVTDADCVVTDTWVSMGDKDGEQPPQSAQALSGQCAADGAGQARTRFSCIACRRIAARRSPTR